MKTQTLIIGLSSVAASLVSAIAYVHSTAWVAPMRARPSPAGEVSFSTRSAPESPAPPRTVEPAPAPKESKPPFSWRQIESEDYHQYIANLRAFGCPEQTIRDIIVADVNKLYAARENPLKAKPQTAGNKATAETQEQEFERLKQLRAVQQEKRWVVKELLNIDLPLDLLPSSGSRDYHAFEVAFKFLPESKRDPVQLLQEKYWQDSDALKTKYGSKRTPEFLAESRQLSDSLRQELSKVLAPQELEDYEMRTSAAAKQLSTKLASYFGASEDEFRKIYRAKATYDEAVERLSVPPVRTTQTGTPVDPQAMAQQRAADKKAVDQARASALTQMNDQLKSSLGEDRFNEYERSQDRTYDLLARLGVRYNLPQETVLQAYEAQKSFGQPAAGNGPASPGIDRAELQNQLNARLTAILGEQAARGYQRVQGGSIPLP